jgi:hypothetical protein
LLTCWIYDHDQNNLKIIKAGSTLHVDNNSFSSVPFEGSHSVEDDGVVLWVYNNELLQVDKMTFKYDNPYDI